MLSFRLARLLLLTTALAAGVALAQTNARGKRPVPLAAPPSPAAVAAAIQPDARGSGIRCGDDAAPSLPAAGGQEGARFETSRADPRGQLQELVQRALQRNQGINAATLLAQAAREDWEEARAARLPQIHLNGRLAYAGSKVEGLSLQSGGQGTLSLNVTAPLFDAGRTAQLANWRSQLADAARLGLASAEQQLALQTISLAMDRGRYQLQAQVYGQYVRRMACLVESLDAIVKVDRGRSSELVQAEKSRQQADLALVQTLSAQRQTETRLKRFVGDELPPSASYAALMTQVPDLDEMQRDAEQAPEIHQLDAQARAQNHLAESVAAGYKPQVNLLLGGNATAGGITKSGDWGAGVSVNVPIYQPGADHGIAAARKRAAAVKLQRDDQLEARRYRMADVHEAATSSFDRARRIVDILRNSDVLRTATQQQWQQLGRRSLFDVMGSEADYYALRVAQVNALVDGQQAVAMLWALGRGVMAPLR